LRRAQGIGFEISRKIGKAGGKIIVACRNEEHGLEAVNQLKSEGIDAEFRSLDISDDLSIGRFARDIEEAFGKVSVLVNNAAIAFKGSDPTPFKEQAQPTMTPNFFGTLKLTEALLPLLRRSEQPRIVNMASQSGHLKIVKDEALKERFVNCPTVEELEGLIYAYIKDVQDGVHEQKGWPSSNYGMSKLGVIAMTRIMAAREEQLHPGSAMRINCCCPGHCSTDMSSHTGQRTAEHGARTPAMLALAENVPNGKFFLDEEEIEW
jgi:carbonyl reductase 1